jgi:S-adenosylmethionine:tRNA ribosyltransferase-isomerase
MGTGAREGEYRALVFGAGDSRIPTEERPEPPRLAVGEWLGFGPGFRAAVTRVDPEAPRFVEVCFEASGSEFWQALYRHGQLVQYAYLDGALELWHAQSAFADRPWAFEMPSAGRPLTWQTLFELRLRGVRLASITHAAGLSSTGSAALDQRLPLPERYSISSGAARAIADTLGQGGRVIAVGTTVVRALEAAAIEGRGAVSAGEGVATLVVRPGYRPRIARGLLTGMHEPGSSHYGLMCAFARPELLERALENAERSGYLAHEFGDSCLIL